MLKEKKNNIFVLAIVAILGILLAAPTPAAALDIEGIYMTSCRDYLDGTAYSDPWGFEIWMDFADTGSLHHIDVTPPAGGSAPFTIYEDYGYWEYDSPSEYSTFGDLQDDYPAGTYTLNFEDSSDALLASVDLDYSGISLPGSPVDFTYPSDNGQTDIDTEPTFTWTIDPTAGYALGMWVWDEVTDEDKYWYAPATMDTLSWEPGPLDHGHEYWLEVSVFRIKDPPTEFGLPTMTVNGDTFGYAFMIEYCNEVGFTTVPEPATVALLGLGCLVLIRRRHK